MSPDSPGTPAPQHHYHARLQRVLDYIDHHLDEPLDLATLSAVAGFSRFHFHRQFSAVLGLPLHRYVQLCRMKRASWRLAFRPDDRVTDIALDAGYEAPEAFSRAFRQRLGQGPSDFRKAPDWAPWLSAFEPLTHARNQLMSTAPFTIADVRIVERDETPIAFMTHRGDPARLGDTIRRFIDWRKREGVRPVHSATFTVFHNDPDSVPPEDYRIDLAAGTARRFDGNTDGIEHGSLPAGRHAVLRVIGRSDDLRPAAVFLYGDWLPASGEQLRDAPLFAQRVVFFPDVPEHEAVTDLFLPLALSPPAHGRQRTATPSATHPVRGDH